MTITATAPCLTQGTWEIVQATDMASINRAAGLIMSYLHELRGGAQMLTVQDWERVGRIVSDASRDGRHRLYLAHQDGLDVAVASLSDRGELGTCWVVPTHRRQGIAQGMIRHRVQDGGWFASVLPNNTASAAALVSMGFRRAAATEAIHRYVYDPGAPHTSCA